MVLKDKVCISKTDNDHLCAKDFKFMAITNQEGLNGADGILGLSPAKPENGPSYV